MTHRQIGTIILDDNINTFLNMEPLPFTRDIQLDRMLNRYGRQTRTREDVLPLSIPVLGTWRDGGGKYFMDFKAALMGQSRVPFILGDGTRFEMVDVKDCVGKKIGGI